MGAELGAISGAGKMHLHRLGVGGGPGLLLCDLHREKVSGTETCREEPRSSSLDLPLGVQPNLARE